MFAPLLLAACQLAPQAPQPGDDRSELLEPCRVPGVSWESLCGTIEVFEDRQAGSGRKIPLKVLVLPAVSEEPRPDPLFFLAGGPGQAATEVAGQVDDAFWYVHRDRDIVFVDQRGTGSSNPLDCEEEEDLALEERFDPLLAMDELEACRDELDADLTQYTTPIAMDDLDEVRKTLGYDQINLYGGSYGTRAALVYARRHPEHTRAMILDGLAPTMMRLFLTFPEDGQAALEATFADCEADPGCSEAFPTLREDFHALLETLGEPTEVTVRHPVTGERTDVTLVRDSVTPTVRALLYQPALTSLFPLMVTEARRGFFDSLVALGHAATADIEAGMSAGMMLSVVCAEDVPRFSLEEAREHADGTFMGPVLAETMKEACDIWPRGELPDGYNDPVTSDAPTLLLSGALDPVTPPRWGNQVAESLPSSVHVVAPGAGHNVVVHGCAPQLMETFLESGIDGLDVSCLTEVDRPPFFIDFAGPLP